MRKHHSGVSAAMNMDMLLLCAEETEDVERVGRKIMIKSASRMMNQ